MADPNLNFSHCQRARTAPRHILALTRTPRAHWHSGRGCADIGQLPLINCTNSRHICRCRWEPPAQLTSHVDRRICPAVYTRVSSDASDEHEDVVSNNSLAFYVIAIVIIINLTLYRKRSKKIALLSPNPPRQRANARRACCPCSDATIHAPRSYLARSMKRKSMWGRSVDRVAPAHSGTPLLKQEPMYPVPPAARPHRVSLLFRSTSAFRIDRRDRISRLHCVLGSVVRVTRVTLTAFRLPTSSVCHATPHRLANLLSFLSCPSGCAAAD
jgi:hypothetical protein